MLIHNQKTFKTACNRSQDSHFEAWKSFEVFPNQQLGYQGRSTTTRQIDKQLPDSVLRNQEQQQRKKSTSQAKEQLDQPVKLGCSEAQTKVFYVYVTPLDLAQGTASAGNHCRQRRLGVSVSSFLPCSDLGSQVVALCIMMDNSVPLFLCLLTRSFISISLHVRKTPENEKCCCRRHAWWTI